ncbi:MAG: hypothetical protein AB1847_12385 [bacterium]
MMRRKGSWSKTGLMALAFGLVLMAAIPSRGSDDICKLCDESSVKIGFGSSATSHEKWYDLSPVFRLGNQIMVHTNNPWDRPDKPNITIYASFDLQQNIKLHPQDNACPCDDQGHRATLSAAEYHLTIGTEVQALAARLRADGVPKQLWSELMGPYVYRVDILAPDYGLSATTLLSLTHAANYAIGKAQVDHYRMDDNERARVCNYAGTISQEGAEIKGADASRRTSSSSVMTYGKSSPLMALIK